MSGFIGPKTISTFLEHGATWFIAKPVDIRALKNYFDLSLHR